MQTCYIKETRILFCTNYSTISTNVYCTLKIAETLNLRILVRFVFCNYVILGGHFLNISRTIFLKVILHLRISYELHDVRLPEF